VADKFQPENSKLPDRLPLRLQGKRPKSQGRRAQRRETPKKDKKRAQEQRMVSRDFALQVAGYGLTTAAIHYHLPDHPSLLQLYVWQAYDMAPNFPSLRDFLRYWEAELDGALHSVRVAHCQLIKPAEWRKIDGVITIQ